MKTTLGKIREYNPCKSGWWKLLHSLNMTPGNYDKGKEVTILEILESNGVEDAFWCLRTQEYKDYCIILADVAESVLHIFEKDNPGDKRPRKAIEGVRAYHRGEITKKDLEVLAADAADAAAATAYDDAYAAAYATAYAAADDAADAAAYADADDAAYAAADAAADAATAAYAAAAQWKKNEEILRRYL